MTSEPVLPVVASPAPGANIAEVICVLNRDGLIRFATPATAAFYGYRLEDLIGRSGLRFIAPESVEPVIAAWKDMIGQPESRATHMSLMMSAANGRRIPIRTSIWRLPDRDEFLVVHHVVEHLRERLDTLYSIMADVSGTLELNTLLDNVLCQVHRLIPCSVSTVYILERDGALRFRRWARDASQAGYSRSRDHLPDFETSRIMRATGRPLLIHDCATDPRWYAIPGHSPIRSWLGAPLIHYGDFMGEINLDSEEVNAFSEEDAELVLALASQVAAAVHNVRQFEDEQRRAKRYQALSDMSHAISRLELSSVLQVAYEKITSLMDTSTFFIGLYDPETRQVNVLGAYDHGQRSPDAVMSVDEGLTGLVIRNRQRLIIHDSAREPLPDEIIIDGDMPRSLLMFPLMTLDDVVGMITVQSYLPDAYSPDDIETLEIIAGAIATAVSNAQLYDQALERLTALETLHQMSLDLVVTQDPNTIAELVTRTAVKLFQPGEVRLCLCDHTPWEPRTWVGHPTADFNQPQIMQRDTATRSRLILRMNQTKQPVIEHDLTSQPQLQDEFATPWPVRAAAIYPITRSGHEFAALSLLYPEATYLRRDLLRTLELLCMQAATAFENARYTITLRRRLDEVTALQDLAREVSSRSTLVAIFDVVVHTLQAVYQCRGAWIALSDSSGTEVYLKAASGLAPEMLPHAHFAIGEYGVGRVVQTGQALYVADTLNDPDFRVVDPGVRSVMIVPLTVRGQVIGALGIDGAVPHAFVPEHERLLNIAGGQIAAAIETINLLQQTRERADELAVANAALEAQDVLRRELVYQVSHDLRSPLQIIYGYADLLRNGELGPVTEFQTEVLDLMLRRTRSIERLTLDIMAAKPISNDMLDLTTIDLNEMCRQAIADAQMLNAEESFTFTVRLAPGEIPVQADYNRLSRVFDNLIGNAVKFSPEGGTITLTSVLDPDTRRATVSITDQGIGIAPDQISYIFERFFRGNRKRFAGSGLGLYTVQQIIEAHQGQVGVTSELGVGSTFTFTLPLAIPNQ